MYPWMCLHVRADNISSLCMASAGSGDYKTVVENMDIRAAEEVFCVPHPEHSCSQAHTTLQVQP